MSLNFYSKDNKIIVNNSGNPILCDKCPCETDDVYYAIIGFRMQSTSYQNPTQISNKCYYYHKVEVKKVINGRILVQFCSTFPSWGRPEHYMIWLDITKNLGFCGSGYGYCNYYVEAYNISDKIYTDLDQFKEYFWSGCGVQPTDGVYPDIWDVYSYDGNGVDKMKDGAGEATTCIGNYWNKVFTDIYMPSFKLTASTICQNWHIHLQDIRYHYNDYCWCVNDQDEYCGEPDPWPDGDCLQEGCTNRICDIGWEDYIEAFGQSMYKKIGNYTPMSTYIWFDLIQGGPDMMPYDWPVCWDINSIGTVDNINNVLSSAIRNTSEYIWTPGTGGFGARDFSYTSVINSYQASELCLNFEYWSSLIVWHQDVVNYWEYLFRWSTLSLERNDNTPSTALGVNFDIKIYDKILYYPNTDINNPNVSSLILSSNINLYYNQNYNNLPLNIDIPLPQIIERPTCSDENCQQCEGNLIITPFAQEDAGGIHPSGWIKAEGYRVELTAKEYIFNNN